jgi:hypothetical protein
LDKKMARIQFSTALITFTFGLLLGGCGLFPGQAARVTPPPRPKEAVEVPSPAGTAALVLDFGEGEVATYSASPDEETTVFDLLTQAADKFGYKLETQKFDFGVFVKAIGGRESSRERTWIYFVNGKAAQVAADQAKVKPGDRVEWRYVKPE